MEFPLSDEEGRRKLVALYARGLEVGPEWMDLIVRRTKGASPAFIKELMRRSTQFQLEQGGVQYSGGRRWTAPSRKWCSPAAL